MADELGTPPVLDEPLSRLPLEVKLPMGSPPGIS